MEKGFEEQNLFTFDNLNTFSQSQHGTVEQVVSKRLLSTSFIAAMTEKDQLQLKAQFEKIVYDFTGLEYKIRLIFHMSHMHIIFKKYVVKS